MILDALLKLVDAQAVTTSAAGNNVIDLGLGGRDLSIGEPMSIMIVPSVNAVGTGTYSFKLQHSDDNSSFTDVGPDTAVTPANLAVGKGVYLPMPVAALKRYIRLYITTGATSPGVTFSAYIEPTDLIQKDRYYAKGYTITG